MASARSILTNLLTHQPLPAMMLVFGVWRSPVAHLVWDQGVQGSNPCTPTKIKRDVDEFNIPFFISPLSLRPCV